MLKMSNKYVKFVFAFIYLAPTLTKRHASGTCNKLSTMFYNHVTDTYITCFMKRCTYRSPPWRTGQCSCLCGWTACASCASALAPGGTRAAETTIKMYEAVGTIITTPTYPSCKSICTIFANPFLQVRITFVLFLKVRINQRANWFVLFLQVLFLQVRITRTANWFALRVIRTC